MRIYGGHKTICFNCKHWKLTKPALQYGWCSLFNKQTEWCAGIVWQVSKKFRVCPGFKFV